MASYSNSNKCLKSHQNSFVDDKNDESDVDRISNLPDSVLCHILSFLPTKDAVANSMLSTKWKYLFPLIPNLKLDLDDNGMDIIKFEKFVDTVLDVVLREGTRVHALRLYCNQDCSARIKSWIRSAVRLNVQSLDFKFMIRDPRWFPHQIGSCANLTTLKLSHSPLYVLDYFCLPNLKILNLDLIGLFMDTTISNLFSGFPVLEELTMVDCRVYTQILNICVPTLKRLKIQDCMYELPEDGFEDTDNFEVVLSTPALEEFYYYDYHAAARYTMNEFKCLQIVRLDVKPNDKQEAENTINFDVNVAELVRTCYKTKSLYLSARTMQAIYSSGCVLTLFPNLKCLDLELSVVCPRTWGLVLHILDCAPNISSLGVEMGLQKQKQCEDCEPALAEWVPDCFTLHLGKISISAFTGGKHEFMLVDYFLKHAKNLEKMVISFDSDLKREEQLSIKENLVKLPHWSKTCVVVFKTHVGKNVAK